MTLPTLLSADIATGLALAGFLALAFLTQLGIDAFLKRRRAKNPTQTYALKSLSGERLDFKLDDRHTPQQRQTAIMRAVRELKRRDRFNDSQ